MLRLAQIPGLPSSTWVPAAAIISITLISASASAEILNYSLRLDGGQEVPPVTTTATGSGTATLDTDTNLFSWNITFSGLSAPQTAAHFHGPALQCVSAGIVIGLPNGSPIVGSATLTPSQANDLKVGRWYVNIHTTSFPGGEIRGQVMPAPVADPVPGPVPPSPIVVELVPLASGLTAPNWGAVAPGHPDRLFVTDQPGQLWAIDINTGAMTLFMDVSALLVPMGAFGPNTFDERGLLGVAFHPDYLANGRFYTYTSQPVGGTPDFTTLTIGQNPNHQTVVTEWTVPDPANPASLPDMNSARVLLRIDQPQFNHNAGCMNFGPDGLLYIALGDGGAGDDQGVGHGCNGNGQNLGTILGALLRIDPLGNNSANGQYGIPANNPFVGVTGALGEIFVYGLRNPFRFSFDSMTDELWVPDVGQGKLEEINIVQAGDNCGWNHKEGSFFFVRNGSIGGYVTDQRLDGPTGLLDPIAEYDHDEGISIIGGFVYRGARIEPLIGKYVFGDFAQSFAGADGRIFHLDENNEIFEFIIGKSGLNMFVLGSGQDSRGDLYIMANATGIPFQSTGVVLRIQRMAGDVNADGSVDVLDLLGVINGWGPCPAPPTACPGDLDGDNQVTVLDLLLVINNWT